MKTLVVFGGTFNPFHIGHEQMLSVLNNTEWVDKILVIPSKIPPHKTVDFLAFDNHRLNFCKIISEKFCKAEVSDIEINREDKSYSIDTLEELKQLYPDCNIVLAIGGDMAVSFNEWREYEKILKIASLAVFSRVGINSEKLIESIEYLRSLGGKIVVLEDEIVSISSTEIRENIDDSEFLKKYLPPQIYDYIINKKVYEN